MAGPFESAETESALRALPGWTKVDYRGIVAREAVRDIMAESCAGLLFFHPEPNHIDAQPNKMFEYMSAGLPVLASDFPLWRALLVDSGAGICADPMDPRSIARAIGDLLADPDAAQTMGEHGRLAVMTRYQWTIEEAKLVSLYERLLRTDEP
jgi:glycosyltransferase involved in cell wall biosynthesis